MKIRDQTVPTSSFSGFGGKRRRSSLLLPLPRRLPWAPRNPLRLIVVAAVVGRPVRAAIPLVPPTHPITHKEAGKITGSRSAAAAVGRKEKMISTPSEEG